MSDATDRLRRLVDDETGAGRDADLDDRLVELESLADRTPETAADDVPALRALGDATRYRVVRGLVAASDDELAVCEVNALLGVSESAVSHALSDLADAGLVEGRSAGRWRYYRATDRAEALVAALDGTRDDD